jgi:hypothetical protein
LARTDEGLKEVEETYRLLAKGEGFRIGLATTQAEARPPTATMEFLVRLFRTGQMIRPEDMEKASELVKGLAGMGYSIFFQEDGWISCEKPVGDARAETEARHLQTLMGSR